MSINKCKQLFQEFLQTKESPKNIKKNKENQMHNEFLGKS